VKNRNIIFLASLIFLSIMTIVESASYRQIGPIEDTSYANVKRISAYIVVPTGLSEKELRILLKDAVTTLGKQHRASAAMILAYREEDEVTGHWTAGKAVYAPGGKWEDAGKASPMQVQIEVGKVYFEKQEEKIPERGDKVVLEKSDRKFISLSRSRDAWGDDQIIASVPVDTTARVLEHYKAAITSDYILVRYLVSTTLHGKKIQGWVFNDEVSLVSTQSKTSTLPIRQIQQLLKDDGFNPGPLDGIFGQRTKEALIAYQIKMGLPLTGIPDEATLKSLGLSGN
jgi:hypothetical protein